MEINILCFVICNVQFLQPPIPSPNKTGCNDSACFMIQQVVPEPLLPAHQRVSSPLDQWKGTGVTQHSNHHALPLPSPWAVAPGTHCIFKIIYLVHLLDSQETTSWSL